MSVTVFAVLGASRSVSHLIFTSILIDRTKLLKRYYLNNSDAYRLKFWFEKALLLQQQEAQIDAEIMNETNK